MRVLIMRSCTIQCFYPEGQRREYLLSPTCRSTSKHSTHYNVRHLEPGVEGGWAILLIIASTES